MKNKIQVNGVPVRVKEIKGQDYICITDIAKSGIKGEPRVAIFNYIRNRNNIEFLGLWEKLHNENFNVIEFDDIKSRSGLNNFILSATEWTDRTKAIGIESTAGRYGGTFVHIDIALHFTNWFDAEFYLLFIQDYKRLKADELRQLGEPFDVSRLMASSTFPLLTEGIKTTIPAKIVGTKKEGIHFASEVDMINVILFGMTAKDWKKQNPKAAGNMRDHATTIELLILAALQALNERLIKWQCDKQQRFDLLSEAATDWKNMLSSKKSIKELSKRIDKQRNIKGRK